MKKINKFISFIGVVRTGHSFISSVLDAHHNIAISIEVNPLLRFERGDSREKLFNKIFTYCKNLHKHKRSRGGHSYVFNGGGQGNLKNVKIIGDSMTTVKNMKKLSNDHQFKKFCEYIGVPIYWIWVIRDPFESAHSGHKISGMSIDDILKRYYDGYFLSHKFNKKHNVFVIYLEDLIKNPKTELSNLLDFIGVSYNDDFLDICSNEVLSKPNEKFTLENNWTRTQINKMNQLIKNIPELNKYKLR